ncbi:MAG: DUF4214 domain-containing protein [Acidimicrobiales bacterium]|nr:DUF4214 domain-containing protein [Acidimicrobiales bacterium]
MSAERWSAVLVTFCLVAITSPFSSQPVAAQEIAGPVGGRFATVELFVDQAYSDVLGRSADEAGLRYWSGLIRNGTSPVAVYNELVTSPEFGGTVAPVTRLYYSVFGRTPDLSGLRYWVGVRQGGATLEQLAVEFLRSSEFAALSSASSDAEVVTAVYGRVLGRPPDTSGLAYWIDLIASGQLTLPGFVVAVSESPEHRIRRDPEVAVTAVYLGLLQRLPEPSGAAYWADQVRRGASLVDLIAPVMASAEYRNRFAEPPTVSIEPGRSVGLTIPWDVLALPGGDILIAERSGALSLSPPDGSRRSVIADFADLFANGETGLMGMALDPDFAGNRRFYTCQGHSSPREIQVIAWTLDVGTSAATRVADPLVAGIPIGSGRHGGCQLEIDASGQLIVGTGDAAIGSLPQNLTSLGGKTLRVDRFTGAGVSSNPFSASSDPNTRKLLSFGHRNVQGVAVHPSTRAIWTAEHGPTRDDEVNQIDPGGNYGWNPVPGYNESVPMTDTREFPTAVSAAWATGAPTLALSGATFLSGKQWGSWENGLAVASLKDSSLRILFFNSRGVYRGQQMVIRGEYGRLRAVTASPDGSLLVTTSNGGGGDQVLRIVPG